MPKKQRKVATIDSDSSIHEVYGQKKEGADYAYTNTYSYITLAESGDMLHQDLRPGNTYSSVGTRERLPAIIDRVGRHFEKLRYRGDSAFYDKGIVEIVDEADVEFFITAEQRRPLMKEILSLGEEEWKSFRAKNIGKKTAGKRRKKRKNHRRQVAKKRKKTIRT